NGVILMGRGVCTTTTNELWVMNMRKQTIRQALRALMAGALVSATAVYAGTPSGGGSGSSGLQDRINEVQQRCDASSMLPVDSNPAVRGPWPVGSRTLEIRGLTTEVFYPASPGSQNGKPVKTWD